MNKWDQRYCSDAYIYGTEPNDFLRDQYQAIPQGEVLSLAEGEGRNAVFLALKDYRVTAVDSSAVGLSKAELLAEDNLVELTLHHADLADFDLGENRWEGIVSIFCHLPPEIRTDVYQRVVKALKPGGVFLLEAYTEDQLKRDTGGPPTADLMLSQKIIQEELAPLEFTHLQEVERDIWEGSYHTGPGCVVQALGIKPAT